MATGVSVQRVALAALSLVWMSASAQQVPDIGFASIGRAAPLEHDVNRYEWTGAATRRDGRVHRSRAGRRGARRRGALGTRPVHLEGLLQGSSAVERSALLPLQ